MSRAQEGMCRKHCEAAEGIHRDKKNCDNVTNAKGELNVFETLLGNVKRTRRPLQVYETL